MKLLIHFLLIGSLSIITIDGTIEHLSKSDIGKRIKRDQSYSTGLPNYLKLTKKGEIFRNDDTVVWKGTYYDATDVAIKIFNKKSRFEEEMKIFDVLNATNDFDIEKHRIPRVYHSGTIFRNYDAIVMTLFEGSLEKRIELQKEQFSDSTILLIFRQLMKTLEYIHSKDVLHNDIRSKNIFIHGQEVFIGNFDSSRLNGSRISDYQSLLRLIWRMVVPKDQRSEPVAVKLTYFTNLIVRKAFESILRIKCFMPPDYEEIIKEADKALIEIGEQSEPVQFDWLKKGPSGLNSFFRDRLKRTLSGASYSRKKSSK